MYCAALSKLTSRYQVYITSRYENLPTSLKQWNNILKSEAFQDNRRFMVHLWQAILMHKLLQELLDAAETFEG
jgi:5'(3')-deoxyribonucleotidase